MFSMFNALLICELSPQLRISCVPSDELLDKVLVTREGQLDGLGTRRDHASSVILSNQLSSLEMTGSQDVVFFFNLLVKPVTHQKGFGQLSLDGQNSPSSIQVNLIVALVDVED